MEKRSTMEELMEVLSALKPEIDFTKETELIDEGLLESFDVITLIAELEDKMPKGISLTAFNSSSAGVSFTGNTKTYEDIAAFAINLKEIECIDNTFIQSVTENAGEDKADTTYDFTVSCIYKDASAENAEAADGEVAVQ